MNISGIDLALLRFCLKQDDGPAQDMGSSTAELLKQRNPEDYEWLKKALASVEDDNERIKKYLAVVADENAELADKEFALEQVQYLVEDLDLANDLAKRGLGEVTQALTCDDGPEGEGVGVRAMAAWVLATMVQNNAYCQTQAVEQGVFGHVLCMLVGEQEAEVQVKLLAMVSGMVRDCPAGVELVVSRLKDSPEVFRKFLQKRSLGIRLKARLVCTHLLSSGVDGAVDLVKASGIDQAAAELYVEGASALDENTTENEISLRLFSALAAAGLTDALIRNVLPILDARIALLKSTKEKDLFAAERLLTAELKEQLCSARNDAAPAER